MSLRSFFDRFSLSPSTRKTAEYMEFDRAVKSKTDNAVQLGMALLERHPSDKLLRKRTGAVAFKNGDSALAAEILLGHLTPKKKMAIHRAFNRVRFHLPPEFSDSHYAIRSGGTHGLALFYQDNDCGIEGNRVAVAKVLSRLYRGDRNEIRFYSLVHGLAKHPSQLPKLICSEDIGFTKMVVAIEYVLGQPPTLGDAALVRRDLELLQESTTDLRQGRSRKSVIVFLFDIGFVVGLFLLRKRVSLRCLVQWLHLTPVCLLLNRMIGGKKKTGVSDWESAFGRAADQVLRSSSIRRRLFPSAPADLVHGDLNKGNVLIVQDASMPNYGERCVFFDWENWHFGFMEHDFAHFFAGAPPNEVNSFADSIGLKQHHPNEESNVRQARFIFLWLTAELFRWNRSKHSVSDEGSYLHLVHRFERLALGLSSSHGSQAS